MKKIFISVFAMALAAPAFAQLEQGQFTVGGSIGVNVENSFGKYDGKIEDQWAKTREFSIAPELGYMISDDMQLGLALSYDMLQNYNEDLKQNQIGVGVFARKFFPIADKLSFAAVAKAGVFFGSADLIESVPNYNAKANIFGYGVQVAPEFWFHLTPKTSLTAQLGNISFTNETWTADEDDKFKDTETKFGFNWNAVTFGVNFAF